MIHQCICTAAGLKGSNEETVTWQEVFGELGSSSEFMAKVGAFFFRTEGRDVDPWMLCVVEPYPQVRST